MAQFKLNVSPTFQDIPEKADPDVAMTHAFESILRDKDGQYIPVCSSGPEDFGFASIGLEMYFRFLKEMGLLFVLLSLLAAPALYVNYIGNEVDPNYEQTVFDRMTISNQNGVSLNTTAAAEALKALSDQELPKHVTIWFDVASCALFFILWLVYRFYNWRCELSSKATNLSAASYAVMVEGLPQALGKSGEQEVGEFFQGRFGKVVECCFAREFNNALGLYKTVADISKEISKEQIRCQISGKPTSAELEKLTKERASARVYLQEALPNMEDYESLPVNRAFIIFDTIESKQKCIETYSHCECCGCCGCGCLQENNLRFPKDGETYQLDVKKPPPPSDIIWENLEASCCSKFWRSLLAVIAVIILLIISYTSIYTVNTLEQDRATKEECIQYEEMDLAAAKIETNKRKIRCFCTQEGIIKIQTNAEEKAVCDDFISEIYVYWVIYLGCIFSITVINFIIKYALLGLSKFQKFCTKTEEEQSAMVKLFSSMTINMILLILMTNLNLQGSVIFSTISDVIPFGKYIFSGDYTDFDRSWHLEVGVTIIIMMCMSVFWPQIMDFCFWVPLKRLGRLCTGNIVLQQDLNEIYEGYDFTLWDRYSYILTIVFFVVTFSPGLPILMPLGAAFCFVIYWIDKWLLLRFYKKPPAFTCKINTKAFEILPYAILCHAIIALFVYTSPDIYPQEISEKVSMIAGQTAQIYDATPITILNRVFF